ncbi:hypothetical protein [Hymenobacter norwichensis]|uniref:hypothetical protein n=1 Tax=Hymenobacter norwichensis TaxID=223903 RepID=UPI0003B3B9E9|nr:hypothetical protein [Hymenobacter norwichensis]
MRESTTNAPSIASALAYFQHPQRHCWRWVEEARLVEWQNGNTICYREELARVLRGLLTQGLPPITPVLLLLAACADTWPAASGGVELVRRLAYRTPQAANDPPAGQLETRIDRALAFLAVVRALPATLRTEQPKVHLFREVFSAQAPQVTPDLSRAVLDDWNSGLLDQRLSFSGEMVSRRAVFHELACLAQALERFPTTESLALQLRTGLPQLPEPLPAVEPAGPDSIGTPADLLDQLAQDARTAGLAYLTQHVAATLPAPLPTPGASDQPLGGIAGVTTRGNFDRLLLSELAHDDVSLLARLVNNEALYLHREEAPRPPAQPQLILLDTTLRLWGVPRIFALAAALAWTRNAYARRPSAPVTAFALGGHESTPLDLTSFEGVVTALSQLDPALHCGPALQQFWRTQAPAAATHCLLITEAEGLQQTDFSHLLREAQPRLRFLLTVDRQGTLAFYDVINGHRVLRSTSNYNLEELLFAPPLRQSRRLLQPTVSADGPAFIQCNPAPLFLPTTGLRVSPKNTFYSPPLGMLGVTDTQRVLYWPSKDTGAREVLPLIEAGTYHFGTDDGHLIYLLVSAGKRLLVYVVDTVTLAVEQVDLSAELDEHELPAGTVEQAPKIVFLDYCYHVRRASSTLVFNCLQLAIVERRAAAFPAMPTRGVGTASSQLKRHINNGYAVLLRVNSLGINNRNELVLEGHEIRLINRETQELQLLSRDPAESHMGRLKAIASAPVPLSANEKVTLRRFTWSDGSTAVVDSRGLLHLRSADITLPEITLTLIIGQPLAAWTADGSVCGSSYFTGTNLTHRLWVPDFYQRFLLRFIAHLG